MSGLTTALFLCGFAGRGLLKIMELDLAVVNYSSINFSRT
jgi:hypothetical protein